MATGRIGAAGLATAMVLALGWTGAAVAGPEAKIDRQIEVFERVLDDAFVQSPNWLVQGQHESRGRYRSGEGARFRIDASLVGGNGWSSSKWWKGWGSDDDRVIIIHGDDVDDYDKMDRAERKEQLKKVRERSAKRDERLYSRGKAELVDTMMDFGDLLSAVPDGESLTIEVDLERADYFDDQDLSKLTMKAKMGDLRAYSDGKIDEKTMVNRIQVSES